MTRKSLAAMLGEDIQPAPVVELPTGRTRDVAQEATSQPLSPADSSGGVAPAETVTEAQVAAEADGEAVDPAWPEDAAPTQGSGGVGAPDTGTGGETAAAPRTVAFEAPQAPVIPIIGPNARWIHFERKDTRLRADQLRWTEAKRKQLNTLRAGRGDRLTDNTLIRIALDLLIERGDELAGTTENELRASLGLPAVDTPAAE